MSESDPHDSRSASTTILAALLAVLLGFGAFFALPHGDDGEVDSPSPDQGTAPLPKPDPGGLDGDSPRIRIDVYRELIALARVDLQDFDRRVNELLADVHSPKARLDALRAAHEIHKDRAVQTLAAALIGPDSDEGVQEFAFDCLRPRCARDRRARDAMLGYLRLGTKDKKRRATAFAEVLHWGVDDEVQSCLSLVREETDPDVVVPAVRGLQANPSPKSRAELEALHWRHPDAKVRQRLRALGIGR